MDLKDIQGRICTVVSCLPFRVNKNIPHFYPGNFTIPEVKDVFKDIELLYVGTSICKFYIGGDRNETGNRDDEGWITKATNSDEVARAICVDEVMSCVDIIPDVAQPAIFWIDGYVNKEEVILKHYEKVKSAREMQRKWFIELVNEADKDYAKLRSPAAVSELQKKAARFLGLKKDWDIETVIEQIAQCPSCLATVHPEAKMCQTCRYILDKKWYAENKEFFMGGLGVPANAASK